MPLVIDWDDAASPDRVLQPPPCKRAAHATGTGHKAKKAKGDRCPLGDLVPNTATESDPFLFRPSMSKPRGRKGTASAPAAPLPPPSPPTSSANPTTAGGAKRGNQKVKKLALLPLKAAAKKTRKAKKDAPVDTPLTEPEPASNTSTSTTAESSFTASSTAETSLGHSTSSDVSPLLFPPSCETAPVQEATLPCLAVVVGQHVSLRRTRLDVDSDLTFTVDVEDGGGAARVVIKEQEVGMYGVSTLETTTVLSLVLSGASGFCAMHIDPNVEDKASILFEVDTTADGAHAALEKIKMLLARVKASSGLMTAPASLILACKARILRLQKESRGVKGQLQQFRGEGLRDLTSEELSALRDRLLDSLQLVQDAMDDMHQHQLTLHQCICCTVSLSSVVLLPCRHMVVCEACFSRLAAPGCCKCPVCRAEVIDHTVVFRL